MTTRRQGLSQHLNYVGLVDKKKSVVALADGGFLLCAEFRGRDQQYTDHDILNHEANQLGHVLARLESGQMLEVQVMRVPCVLQPGTHHCPDPTSARIFEERAAQYAQAGVYYENRHVLALTWLPLGDAKRQMQNFLFEDGRVGELAPREALLQTFIHDSNEFLAALDSTLTIRPLHDEQVTHFLRYCVTNEDRVVGLAPDKGQLNAAVGSTRWAPHSGIIGSYHTRVVGIVGWPAGTHPQMFEPLLQLPFALRLHQRWIALSIPDAVKILRDKEADWFQLNTYNPKRLLWSLLAPLTGSSANDPRVLAVNSDAENQAFSVQREIEAVQSGAVRLGYFTMNVVLHDTDEQQVEAKVAQVMTTINSLGYTAINETDGLGEALLSSWVGHGYANIRQYDVNNQHLARVLPTSVRWRGDDHAPCPYYPEGSGPLVITNTGAQTPFFLNLHQGDLGNFLMVGPSGAGKSYGIGSLTLAFRQYQNAQINMLDRDAAQIIPTVLCGGAYFDAAVLRYAPLARVNEDTGRAWALRLIETMLQLRDFAMIPQARKDVTMALERLGKGDLTYRTFTQLHAQVQTHVPGLKAALEFYTMGKGGSILDGIPGPELNNAWQAWDMKEILGQGEAISTPVIMFLLHEIEHRLDGRPTLTIIEEGWQAAANEWLQQDAEERSANNRKQVNAQGLVLHSPADIYAFARHRLLLDNTPTIICLPNVRAKTPELRKYYGELGLSQRAITILAEDMRPRRDYMQVQGDKYQVFQFDNGPLAHALLAKNGRDEKAQLLALLKQHGYPDVVPAWLAAKGHTDLAEQWQQRNQTKEAA